MQGTELRDEEEIVNEDQMFRCSDVQMLRYSGASELDKRQLMKLDFYDCWIVDRVCMVQAGMISQEQG